ncbi:Protein-export protein SecB [Alteripontixanthobacter maritimus]|uniref:Protein-export protein SecB n=1 Tax=Alteripontixanthobacter maritimus TaxID=2161824 RepID=A0A369QES0_9SPHN|nr:protein-export chaperone SecB [Alteripontixanthobacter maritimus]RDC60788.1 Protein-export protein SecB [Alteripontixanthobacter maritimus]
MADENENGPDILTDLDMDPVDNGPDAAALNGEDTQPVAGIINQYVKDLSVENPNAPDCFQWQEQPAIDLQFNIGARKVNEELQEVELKLQVTASTEQGKVYIVELSYCGLVGVRNLPPEHEHAFLFAEAPRILFPFVRRIVADATRDTGFQPLMLDPIDFNGLYMQQLEQKAQQEAAAEAAGGSPVGNA